MLEISVLVQLETGSRRILNVRSSPFHRLLFMLRYTALIDDLHCEHVFVLDSRRARTMKTGFR